MGCDARPVVRPVPRGLDFDEGQGSRMDSMEINKAVAAFLMAGTAFMGAGLISDALVHPK